MRWDFANILLRTNLLNIECNTVISANVEKSTCRTQKIAF